VNLGHLIQSPEQGFLQVYIVKAGQYVDVETASIDDKAIEEEKVQEKTHEAPEVDKVDEHLMSKAELLGVPIVTQIVQAQQVAHFLLVIEEADNVAHAEQFVQRR